MNRGTPVGEPLGTLCLVLHSHLPWLAHHGNWPVGEEWLYQSWSASYIPLCEQLDRLADRGHRNVLTLGVTPVLLAQLDDPYCLEAEHTWLGFWQERADALAVDRDPALAAVGSYESDLARSAISRFEQSWRHGGSPVLSRLAHSGVVELLSGPATHPFQPLLPDPLVHYALEAGRADWSTRLAVAPGGIWAPECGYRPGLEDVYADHGVTHFVVDGPTLRHVGRSTDAAWTVGDTPVVVFGRDLEVTYRVWSPKKGYPSGSWYRDFHAYHDASGLHTVRVTSTRTPAHQKRPYEPAGAQAAARRDAADFVATVRRRLEAIRRETGERGLVVAAYDTELFGHWWHEGPQWLAHVIEMLPRAGIETNTLAGAIADGHVAGTVHPEPSSWGSGKDWRVWDGPAVEYMVSDNHHLAKRWADLVSHHRHAYRDGQREVFSALNNTALLAVASDWAFMVTKDSAADYARARHDAHHRDFTRLAGAIDDGAWEHARAVARELATRDRPFGRLPSAGSI